MITSCAIFIFFYGRKPFEISPHKLDKKPDILKVISVSVIKSGQTWHHINFYSIENWQKSEINPHLHIVFPFIPIKTDEPKMSPDSVSLLSLTL